eukprot:5477744-Amphidinium_carterae.1
MELEGGEAVRALLENESAQREHDLRCLSTTQRTGSGDELSKYGFKPSEAIPAKVVATEKPLGGGTDPFGFPNKARGRVVCCGNFQENEIGEFSATVPHWHE